VSGSRRASDVVNIGYVVNVIENAAERADTLRDAWTFATRVLIVTARLKEDAKGTRLEAYEDGGLTKVGTFQKFYDQSELREWINQALSVSSVAAAPGVFYVFREESEREAFLATRYRRHIAAPKLRRSDILFEQHRRMLEPLMSFMASRGRLPADDELPEASELRDTFGSVRKAFRVVQRVTGAEQWETVTLQRTEDLLVYLGLTRFDHRPRISQLPRPMQLDVKAFFRNYTSACAQADELLFSLGNRELLSAALASAPLGKTTGNGLYIHVSALHELPSVLRLFEGCARSYVGTVEGATLVKLHRAQPVVSYLTYPEFDRDPHPALASSLLVDLQTFRVHRRDYVSNSNPPILHRKELFVAPKHPLREKFARLTAQEERAGLLDSPESIGTRDGWTSLLSARGLALRGHRLVTAKQAPTQPSRPLSP
jgi:DNA phosphorothioation-associated putative methyltransferase